MAQKREDGRRGTVATCRSCGRSNHVPAAATGVVRCDDCHGPLPWIIDASDETFAAVAEHVPVPVLVDLWAAWCDPCHKVSPALEQVARDMAGKVKLVKVDVSHAPRTQARFGAQAVPALLLMWEGKVIDRRAGLAPARALRQWVEKALTRCAGA